MIIIKLGRFNNLPKINISTDFLRIIYKQPREVQNHFFDKLDQLSSTTTNSMNTEKMYNTSSGKNIHSIRINEKYRALVHIEGDTWYFLNLANHEPAYDSVKKIDVLSILEVSDIGIIKDTQKDLKQLFAGLSNKEMNKLGVTTDYEISVIRKITNITELKRLKEENIISEQAAENLEMALIEKDFNLLVTDYRIRSKKACDLLIKNVVNPALACDKLDPDIKAHVLNTKERLLEKESLQEILYYYNDALEGKTGKEIYSVFQSLGLKSFEDYQEEILNIAKGY